ncbi:MAG: 4Fe-4S binding protein [Thermoplasmatota archaeon]
MNSRRRSGSSKGRRKGSRRGSRHRRSGEKTKNGRSVEGSSNNCVCPNCGEKVPHQRGVPCNKHQCPSCGTSMVSNLRSQGVNQKQTSVGFRQEVSSTDIPMVNEDKCTGCGVCSQNCPENAIFIEDGKAKIRPYLCRNCGICISVCPNDAIV